MSSLILKDAEVIINSVDLSDHVMTCRLNYSGDLQEETAMGDNTRKRLSGLKDWSMEFTFKQDFDSGSVDATLFSLIGAAAVTVTIKGVQSTATGDTNPKYSGSAVLGEYNPFGNSVGELATVTASFSAAGDLSSGRLTLTSVN